MLSALDDLPPTPNPVALADRFKVGVRACNEYCRDLLDYDRGDELLQLGRADAFQGMRLGIQRRFLNGS